MTKMASIHERDGEWYIQPSSITTTGLWIETLPLQKMSAEESLPHKGEAILNALNESRDQVPMPADEVVVSAPLLAAARVNSWSHFMRRAKCVQVFLVNDQLRAVPDRKVDPKATEVVVI